MRAVKIVPTIQDDGKVFPEHYSAVFFVVRTVCGIVLRNLVERPIRGSFSHVV